jgi:hypothetical protein
MTGSGDSGFTGSRKRRLAVVLVAGWISSLVGVAVWAQQGPTQARSVHVQEGQAIGDVITGENIGFQRVYSTHSPNGKVVGKLMIKVDGRWLEAQSPIGIVR